MWAASGNACGGRMPAAMMACVNASGSFRDIDGRQPAEDPQSFLDFGGVANRCLIDYNLRNRTREMASSIVPPFVCGLLMPRDNYIPTGPRDQVADKRSFQIDGFHADPSHR